MLHKSTGIVQYGVDNVGFVKVIVTVDPEIYRYYFSLIPKYIDIQPQLYPAHISVVRKESVIDLSHWQLHDNEVIEFYYDSVIKHGEVYWWLDAFSIQLEQIRVELGLSIEEHYTIPPEPFYKTFHISLGNSKLFL